MRARSIAVVIAVVIAASSVLHAGLAAAQAVPTVLLKEGDALSAPPGHTVSALSVTEVNHAGGYAVTANSTDGVATLSHVWGSFDGAAPDIIRTETTIGDLEQSSFEGFFGVGAATVAYSATTTDLVGGSTGLDGVWTNDVVVANEEQPYPNEADTYWSFGSRPTTTNDGVIYWIGGITSTVGGSTQRRGLFTGAAATPLLLGGETVPGIPAPLDATSAVAFDFSISADGTSYIAEVSAAADAHIVVDGSLLLIDGAGVSEGVAVPTSAGGLPGESWANFDFTGITESGEYAFTGDTDAATTVDEFLVKNGDILYRQGDTIDGQTVTGSITDAYMNEDGDIAFVWDTAAGEALFVNDRFLFAEGDPVDVDGDGAPDAGTTILDITGISALSMSDRTGDLVTIYLTADVEAPAALTGTFTGIVEFEAYLAVDVDLGAVAVPELTAAAVVLRAIPNPAFGAQSVSFTSPDDTAFRTLSVFDAAGRRVRALDAGARDVTWDGRNDRGRPVAPGVYFVRGETAERAVQARVVRGR